jgi:iron complex outermembrane receptor protein
LDVEFQHNFLAAALHKVTWGVRFRHVSDEIGTNNAFTFQMVPVKRNTDLISGWIQDEISLWDDAVFTVGSKLEHNDFTGVEVQPTARLMWPLDERRVLWGAVSRAVRTPARIEDDIRLRSPVGPGAFLFLQGNRLVESEDLMAYEIGYRAQPMDCLSWDIALFYNDYEDLTSYRQIGAPGGIPTDIPFLIDNIAHAETCGVELSCQCTMTERWRLNAWYSFLEIQSHESFNDALLEERSPHNQVFLMSSWDLPRRIELDVMARYVDILPNVDAPSYISTDARLGWRPSDCWEFSVVGQNLLEPHHVEFAPTLVQTTPTEVSRGVYAQVVWRR